MLKLGARKPSFKELRAQAQASNNAFVSGMVDAGENGWLKHLSALRDGVFHFAPIGAQHSFPACHTRKLTLPDGGTISYISYGLIDRKLVHSLANDASDTEDEGLIKAELQAYKAQLDSSDDALEYSWNALGQLIALCEQARSLSGLKGDAQHRTGGYCELHNS